MSSFTGDESGKGERTLPDAIPNERIVPMTTGPGIAIPDFVGKAIRESYDRVAGRYAQEYYDELQRKAFDRKMLDWLIEKAGTEGPICDMGCGPGQVASYLHSRGARACGLDLSLEMVRLARQLNPGIPFEQYPSRRAYLFARSLRKS